MGRDTDLTPAEAEKTLINRDLPPTCTCDACKSMCSHPCWPTPSETFLLIEAGFGPRLMEDWWEGFPPIRLVCPANKGREGRHAPSDWWSTEREKACTFHTDEGLCELHELGLKPREAQLAHCSKKKREAAKDVHGLVATTWESEEAEDLLEDWREKFQV